MKYLKHLFFDLDRTIWDYETNSKETLDDLFSHYLQGKADGDEHIFTEVFREENTTLWDLFTANKIDKKTLREERFHRTIMRMGIDNRALAIQMEDHYLEHTPSKKRLLPGAVETLDKLSEKYILHIITNGFEDVQHFKLKNCGILHYFDAVVTSDGASSRKPNREIFDYSLERAKASIDESMMIGDDPISDIEGARSAGWKHTILVNSMNLPHSLENLIEVKTLPELIPLLMA
jgi:putative hydrolase of the HAD superfamily